MADLDKLRMQIDNMIRPAGPFVVGLYRSDSLDEQVAQFREAMALNLEDGAGPRKAYAVAAAMDPAVPVTERAWLIATTGNGPKSHINARAIVSLLNAAPALLDLVDAVRDLRDWGAEHAGTDAEATCRMTSLRDLPAQLANVLRAYAKLEG